MRQLALLLFPMTALAGCGGPVEPPAANNSIEATAPLRDNAAVENDSPANMVAPAPAAALDRLDKIRIGATIAELESDGLKLGGRDKPEPGSTCAYAHFSNMPDVAVMLDGEKVARIDVRGKQYEGLNGLKIGQSEADALKALGSTAKVEPHKYTGPTGHNLVVHEDGAPNGLIAETDGKSVLRYRFGAWEQVQWVEGCS